MIGCVDSKAARLNIHNALRRRGTHSTYRLDWGNYASSGQYVFGQPFNTINRGARNRLPTVVEKYPEIIDVSPPLDACISAAILRALSGSTRVSLSPVKNMIARYFVLGFTF